MESHLLQMRGLKHFSLDWEHHRHVASFTDAWIETLMRHNQPNQNQGRIFYRCVD